METNAMATRAHAVRGCGLKRAVLVLLASFACIYALFALNTPASRSPRLLATLKPHTDAQSPNPDEMVTNQRQAATGNSTAKRIDAEVFVFVLSARTGKLPCLRC